MSDNVESDQPAEGSPPPPKKSNKLMLIIIVAVVLLGGGGGAAFFLIKSKKHAAPAKEATVQNKPVFYEMEEVLVTLRGRGLGKKKFVKIQIVLELSKPENVLVVQEELPRLIDSFQVFLRELRPEDFEGTEGILRLKEELLRRVNVLLKPVIVRNILFKNFIIQ